MSKRVIVFFLLLSALLSLQSCRSSRRLLKTPLKEYGENYLIGRMKEAQLEYDWFSSRVAITITDDRKNKTELRGQLRMRRDSAIWISLTPMLNIEAARLLITPDSVKLINRLDKTYYNDDYTLINNLFTSTADFYLLQSLLTGNDLVNYETESFRAAVDNREYRLSSTGRAKKKRYIRKNEQQKILVQNLWLNPENFKISRINLKEVGDEIHRLEVSYSAFERIGDVILPTQLVFEVNAARKLTLYIKYQSPELNQPQAMPFRIPDNFSKMK